MTGAAGAAAPSPGPQRPVDGRAQVLTPSSEGSARPARIQKMRRARWAADLSERPTGDVATLGEVLARLDRTGGARKAEGRQVVGD